MGFMDFFKPAWKHSEPGVRAAAIRSLEEDQQAILLSLALEDQDSSNRLIAARKIKDPELLKKLRDRSTDRGVKELAQKAWVETQVAAAKSTGSDPQAVELGRTALEAIGDDHRAFEDIVKNALSLEIRKLAFAKLVHAGAFHSVALAESDNGLALKALDKVTREAQLESLAKSAKSKAVRIAAKERLKALNVVKGPDAATVNRAKLGLVLGAVDKLAAAADETPPNYSWENGASRLDEAESALTELMAAGVKVEPDPLARFRDGASRFRARYARVSHERAQREEKEKQAAENKRIKEDLCLQMESLWNIVPEEPVIPEADAETALAEAATAEVSASAGGIPDDTAATPDPGSPSPESLTSAPVETKRAETTLLEAAAAEVTSSAGGVPDDTVAAPVRAAAAKSARSGEARKPAVEIANPQLAEVNALRDRFQNIGSSGEGVEGELQRRFRAAAERLERRARDRENLARRSYEEKEHGGRLAELCERAESLAQVPAGQAADRFRELRREWNKALGAAGSFSGKEEYRSRFENALASTQASLDQMRTGNLERMKELIPSLEALLESPDMAAAERRFKELNGEWRSLHPAPVGPEAEHILGRYQAFLDRFREASDWLRWSNMRAKTSICDRLESLHTQEDRKAMVARFKELQAEWKSLGPVPWDSSEALWDRYHQVSDKLYEKCREYFAELDEEREGNLKAKEELCARIEALTAQEDIDWREAMETVKEAQSAWKTIGAVPKVQSDAVWNRFRAAFNAFFERKDGNNLDNMSRKLELVTVAETLQDSTDWKTAGAQIKEAQEKWKTIGPVPRDQADAIWERFHGACEKFYQARRVHIEKQEQEKPQNLIKKEELIQAVESLESLPGDQERFDRIKEAQSAWKEIGPAGTRDVEDALWERFRKPIDLYFEGRKARMGDERKLRDENAKEKEDICIEAESLIGSTEWKATIDKIKSLQERWKATGPAPRDQDRELWKRFRTACDAFFDRLKENSSKRDQERGGNLKRKTDLCFLVEIMLARTPTDEEAQARAAWQTESLPVDIARFKEQGVDWNDNTEKVKAIQREWKKIGPVPRDVSDSLWERFHTACDGFFEERRVALGLRPEDPQANLDKKLELIADAEALAQNPGPDAGKQTANLEREWRRIGAVPRAQSDYVWARFNEALDLAMGRPREEGSSHGGESGPEGDDQSASEPETETSVRP
ncbi:MAG: DUF349 domain-containing protein [Fibrobacterota bacterium]|nr:DUF349 domain-containing protein [Fibrobacterota bacterium]